MRYLLVLIIFCSSCMSIQKVGQPTAEQVELAKKNKQKSESEAKKDRKALHISLVVFAVWLLAYQNIN